jgi:hypothetical protein
MKTHSAMQTRREISCRNFLRRWAVTSACSSRETDLEKGCGKVASEEEAVRQKHVCLAPMFHDEEQDL